MSHRVLYLGDTELTGAAAYLAGLMTSWGWSYRYVPSHVELSDQMARDAYDLIVLSDYPAARLNEITTQALAEQVVEGTGMVMLGGWESYRGLGGDWHDTLLMDLLPVTCHHEDDRANFSQPTLAIAASPRALEHPVLQGLPWGKKPPCIGGLNRFTVKSEAHTLLIAESWRAAHQVDLGNMDWRRVDHFPLLAVWEHNGGRRAALATDVAPHWVGGLVDWGDDRVMAQAEGAGAIEVGSDYARFFRQLLSWAMKSEDRKR